MKTLKESILSQDYDGFVVPTNFNGADKLMKIFNGLNWEHANIHPNNMDVRYSGTVTAPCQTLRKATNVIKRIYDVLKWIDSHNEPDEHSCFAEISYGTLKRFQSPVLRVFKRTANTSDPFRWKGRRIDIFDMRNSGDLGMGVVENIEFKNWQTGELLAIPSEVFDFLKIWIDINQ